MEALGNATKQVMVGGGGVEGAIHDAAGNAFLNELGYSGGGR